MRQMTLLNCLANNKKSVIIDTSVAINLNGTQFSEGIIKALNAQLVMTEIARGELSPGYEDANLIDNLTKRELLQIMPLCPEGEEVFFNLVSGQASQTLDDGEAATIALAHITDSIAAIDEKKATILCEKDFPSLGLVSTIELLSHPNVLNSLGEKNLADAVYNALKFSRMRVPLQNIDWVLRIIGAERAAECTSLPRAFKNGLDKKLA